MSNADDIKTHDRRRTILGLGALFGAMYFVQGIGEPTEGLVGQPVKSFLASRGHDTSSIATFSALLALPWAIKPLFGLLTDLVPLFGTRRRSYLLIATSATTIGLLALFWFFTRDVSRTTLLLALLVPSFAIAFSDVVIDAHMVEQGQRYGMTGRFQSVQWAAIYAAPIIAAPIGGYLAKHQAQQYGFLICGLAAAVSLVLTFFFLRESPARGPRTGFRDALATLRHAATAPGLPVVAGFLFLWNFNPFLNDVLYMHFTRGLDLPETFYGWTISLMGVASVVASIAYGFYCRRVPFDRLLQVAIAMGVVSALGYMAVVGPKSAIAVTIIVGFTYMTGTLVQLDLAARICPPAVAGTTFALLMSLTNIALSAAIVTGGHIYDAVSADWGSGPAFRTVVGLGALASVACAAFIPALRRLGMMNEAP